MPNVIPVILCGGSGTRLWPLSTPQAPKQFHAPIDPENSLLQTTIKRALNVTRANADNLVTITLKTYAEQTKDQLVSISEKAARHIIAEPEARNTAAAIANALIYCTEHFGEDCVLWVLPSDHLVKDEIELQSSYKQALQLALQNKIVTFGITPTYPETGYGYIQKGEHNDIKRFVEKPDLKTAMKYLSEGTYLWNSGMFLFNAQTAHREYERHAPDILKKVAESRSNPQIYAQIEKQPFDIAIMEKTENGAVIPCNPGWNDIGTWQNLLQEAAGNQNVTGKMDFFIQNKCDYSIKQR